MIIKIPPQAMIDGRIVTASYYRPEYIGREWDSLRSTGGIIRVGI